MNKLRLFTVVPAALVMSLVITQAGFAGKPEIQISRNFQPDPLVVKGTSGGTVASNCGNITATPTQVIQITESLPYLRLTVESQGNPTLLINGPGGRFCVLADKYSGGKAELSGYWQAGKYSLHIGNSSQGQQSYTLSISQQNK
jgi:hypothetical protein